MYLHNYNHVHLITIDLESNVLSPSPSTETVNHSRQGTLVTPVTQSPSVEYSQQSISLPKSNVTIVSDTHTTTISSSVITLSVIECLTTSSQCSVVTSFSGLCVSTLTKSEDIIFYSTYIIM